MSSLVSLTGILFLFVKERSRGLKILAPLIALFIMNTSWAVFGDAEEERAAIKKHLMDNFFPFYKGPSAEVDLDHHVTQLSSLVHFSLFFHSLHGVCGIDDSAAILVGALHGTIAVSPPAAESMSSYIATHNYQIVNTLNQNVVTRVQSELKQYEENKKSNEQEIKRAKEAVQEAEERLKHEHERVDKVEGDLEQRRNELADRQHQLDELTKKSEGLATEIQEKEEVINNERERANNAEQNAKDERQRREAIGKELEEEKKKTEKLSKEKEVAEEAERQRQAKEVAESTRLHEENEKDKQCEASNRLSDCIKLKGSGEEQPREEQQVVDLKERDTRKARRRLYRNTKTSNGKAGPSRNTATTHTDPVKNEVITSQSGFPLGLLDIAVRAVSTSDRPPGARRRANRNEFRLPRGRNFKSAAVRSKQSPMIYTLFKITASLAASATALNYLWQWYSSKDVAAPDTGRSLQLMTENGICQAGFQNKVLHDLCKEGESNETDYVLKMIKWLDSLIDTFDIPAVQAEKGNNEFGEMADDSWVMTMVGFVQLSFGNAPLATPAYSISEGEFKRRVLYIAQQLDKAFNSLGLLAMLERPETLPLALVWCGLPVEENNTVAAMYTGCIRAFTERYRGSVEDWYLDNTYSKHHEWLMSRRLPVESGSEYLIYSPYYMTSTENKESLSLFFRPMHVKVFGYGQRRLLSLSPADESDEHNSVSASIFPQPVQKQFNFLQWLLSSQEQKSLKSSQDQWTLTHYEHINTQSLPVQFADYSGRELANYQFLRGICMGVSGSFFAFRFLTGALQWRGTIPRFGWVFDTLLNIIAASSVTGGIYINGKLEKLTAIESMQFDFIQALRFKNLQGLLYEYGVNQEYRKKSLLNSLLSKEGPLGIFAYATPVKDELSLVKINAVGFTPLSLLPLEKQRVFFNRAYELFIEQQPSFDIGNRLDQKRFQFTLALCANETQIWASKCSKMLNNKVNSDHWELILNSLDWHEKEVSFKEHSTPAGLFNMVPNVLYHQGTEELSLSVTPIMKNSTAGRKRSPVTVNALELQGRLNCSTQANDYLCLHKESVTQVILQQGNNHFHWSMSVSERSTPIQLLLAFQNKRLLKPVWNRMALTQSRSVKELALDCNQLQSDNLRGVCIHFNDNKRVTMVLLALQELVIEGPVVPVFFRKNDGVESRYVYGGHFNLTEASTDALIEKVDQLIKYPKWYQSPGFWPFFFLFEFRVRGTQNIVFPERWMTYFEQQIGLPYEQRDKNFNQLKDRLTDLNKWLSKPGIENCEAKTPVFAEENDGLVLRDDMKELFESSASWLPFCDSRN